MAIVQVGAVFLIGSGSFPQFDADPYGETVGNSAPPPYHGKPVPIDPAVAALQARIKYGGLPYPMPFV
jgi:hypothetical protein